MCREKLGEVYREHFWLVTAKRMRKTVKGIEGGRKGEGKKGVR